MHPPFPCEVGGVQRIETVEGRSSIDLLSPPSKPPEFSSHFGPGQKRELSYATEREVGGEVSLKG